MPATASTRNGYRYYRECVEVVQAITEVRFRAIERILVQPPQRFKEWCDRFYFQPLTRETTANLLAYLAEQQIAHAAELHQTWSSPPALPVEETSLTVAELVALAAGLRLTSEQLDDAVHDAAAERAAQINSEGLDGQIEYLVRRVGVRCAHVAVTQAAERTQEFPGMKRRTVPYTWRVGVDNAFGYLARPDGHTRLVESRRFHANLGIAVSLDDGSVLLTVADGSSSWQPVPPDRACELAGISAPAVDGEAETARRLDPFHVERQTSGMFNAIVTVAIEQRLPCGHALRAWRTGLWDGTFAGAYLEAPETFAASVLERITATGAGLAEAIRVQVAQDAMLDPASSQHRQMMSDTGWQTALTDTDRQAEQIASQIVRRRQSHRDAARTANSQLALI